MNEKERERTTMPMTVADAKMVASRAECLFNERDIQTALDTLASQISPLVENENPLVICVMTGGLVVTSELLKRFSFPLELDYLHATRYGNTTVGETIEWITKPRKSLKNRTVLVVDDILDVGKTLHEIVKYCHQEGAENVYSAVLVEKMHERKEGIVKADFTALQVPDRYVFGYGMDYKHYLRNRAGIYMAAKQDE